jgi:hypothetical protein
MLATIWTVALICLVPWIQTFDEMGDAIVLTKGWTTPIHCYDLEIVEQGSTSVGGGDGKHENARIVREVCNRDLDRFLMCNSVGTWTLTLSTGTAHDGVKTSYFEGSSKFAIVDVDGFGMSNASSKTGSCVIGARGIDLGLLPLTFVHGASNAEVEMRNHVIEYLIKNERDSKVSDVRRPHFGKIKKQKRFRYYRDLSNGVGRTPVGYEVWVSAEGIDVGMVAELRLCFLKAGSTAFLTEDDVAYCQCSVRTKWTELQDTDLTVVPIEIDQRFSDGGHSIARTTKLDWKQVNEYKPNDDSISAKTTLVDFKKSVGNVKARVDQLLNR